MRALNMLYDLHEQTQDNEPPELLDMLSKLLRSDPSIAHSRFGELKDTSLLHQAAEFCLPGACQLLLANGVDANIKTTSQDTPLHFVFSSRSKSKRVTQTVIALLGAGAESSAANAHSETPLYLAIIHLFGDEADILLANGCKPDLKSAVLLGDASAVAELITNPSGPYSFINSVPDLLSDALRSHLLLGIPLSNQIAILKLLLDHGLDLRLQRGVNLPPVMMAINEGNDIGIIRLLLERGADPNARHSGTAATALDLAMHGEREQIVSLLRDFGAKAGAELEEGNS